MDVVVVVAVVLVVVVGVFIEVVVEFAAVFVEFLLAVTGAIAGDDAFLDETVAVETFDDAGN